MRDAILPLARSATRRLRANSRLKGGRRAAKDGSADACFLLRVDADDFLFEAVNQAFETSTGLANALVADRALQEVLPQAVAEDIADQCGQCLSGAAPAPFLCVMPSPAGQSLWEFSLAPHVDDRGAVGQICGIAREVGVGVSSQVEDADDPDDEIDRLLRGDQAGRSAARWPQEACASNSELALLDVNGAVISVNAVWRKSLEQIHLGGATHGVGVSYLELCKKGVPGLDEHALAVGISDVIAGHQADYAQPYVFAVTGGALSWRRLRIHRVRVGAAVRLIAIHEDIADLSAARAALRMTSEQLLSAQAQERERIAFELHDTTGQHLAALALGLIRLKRNAGDGATDLIADMSKAVQELVRDIRVLSYLMKPSELERDGLESAARVFVKGFAARTGLHADFQTDGSLRAIGDTVQNAAFRVLQEALSNVYRHAEASCVDVGIADHGDALILRIADDGRGLPRTNGEVRITPGVGFASMQSRVMESGGSLRVFGGAVGTIVEASFPRP